MGERTYTTFAEFWPFYLREQAFGGLTGVIEYFVSRNPRLFRKWRK